MSEPAYIKELCPILIPATRYSNIIFWQTENGGEKLSNKHDARAINTQGAQLWNNLAIEKLNAH